MEFKDIANLNWNFGILRLIFKTETLTINNVGNMKSYFGTQLKEIRDRGAYNSGTLASLHSAFRNVGRTLLESTDMNTTSSSARNFTCSE